MQKISQMGTMFQKLTQYMQLSLALAQKYEPQMAEVIAADVIQSNGGAAVPAGGAPVQLQQGDNIGGEARKEHSVVAKARQKSNDAAQPDQNGAVNTGGR